MLNENVSNGMQPFTKKFGEPLYKANSNDRRMLNTFDCDDESDSDTIEEEENVEADNIDPFLLENSDILPLNSPLDTINTLKALKSHIATSESRSFTNLERQLLATIVQHGILNKNDKEKSVTIDENQSLEPPFNKAVSLKSFQTMKFRSNSYRSKSKIDLDVQKKLTKKLKPKINMQHKSYHPDDKPTLELIENVMGKKDDGPAYEELLSSFLSTKKPDRHSYKKQNSSINEQYKLNNHFSNNDRMKHHYRKYSNSYEPKSSSKRIRATSSSESSYSKDEHRKENKDYYRTKYEQSSTPKSVQNGYCINDSYTSVSEIVNDLKSKGKMSKNNMELQESCKTMEKCDSVSLKSDSKIPTVIDKEDGEL